MTPRERVRKALQHQEADRVPRDLGGTESSGLTAAAQFRLQSHLGIRSPLRVFEPYQYVSHVADELRARLGIDTANLTLEPAAWTRRRNPHGFDVLLPEKWREETDADGESVVRRSDGEVAARRPAGGHYFDPVNPPLRAVADAAALKPHEAKIRSFDLPDFADEPLDRLRARARQMHARGECVVFNLCCHILAAGQLLRGYEQFMVDLLTDEPMVRGILDVLLDSYLRRVDRFAAALSDLVDVVLLNDDLGTQHGPMLSPSTYRSMIKPYQVSLFAHVKRSFGRPILFHSCGAVRDFIPDLLDAGIDALNPIQISAEGMDLRTLKRDFGRSLTFWGGGVDTQSVLNQSRPAAVRDAVRRNVEILAPDGGFVFCQVHNIQPDVPPQNVVAMYEALDACGLY